jgi:hypothetical protein
MRPDLARASIFGMWTYIQHAVTEIQYSSALR